MPLPHRGVGGTLTGGSPGGRGGAGAHQETLFGIAPQHLFGDLAGRQQVPAVVPPVPPPELQRSPTPPMPAAPRTAFGVPTHPGERLASGPAPAPAGGMPGSPDALLQNRTLVGVMADDVRLVAREKVPSHEPRARAPAPAHAPEPVGRGGGTALAWEPARGSTVVGATAIPNPAPQRPTPPPLRPSPPPLRPNASPQRTVLEPQRPLASPREEVGTVRSIASEPPPRDFAQGKPGEVLGGDDEPDVSPAGNAGLPMHARTALGVAIPGIAPLRAGASQPAPAAQRPTRRLEETRLQPDSISTPPLSLRAPMPRGAFVLLGSGLVLLIAAIAFALLWKGKKPLSVAISVDESGKDRIDILCQECPDGTLISLPNASAPISARKAYLTLADALPLGENHVTFGLQSPADPEPRSVELTLPPVEYRIRPNASTLVGDEPRLTLDISAITGSKVEIGGQPVALDASGHGEISVDVGAQLIGPASDVMTFEQAIAYSITPPSGKVYAGELATKISVTPLLLDAPGLDTVTNLERFMLAGRTAKGAELWVAGTAIAVDSQGRFAQLMSIDSVGETRVTVRATAPGLAPRFVSFRLQRVNSLDNEATVRRRTARPLAEVAGSIADHVGTTVVVSGRVEEVRIDGHRTLIVLQSDRECEGRACLARLVYGGLRKLARGEMITAVGRLQGAISAAGGDVPEVDVSLLL
jgi:hypothetical protein